AQQGESQPAPAQHCEQASQQPHRGHPDQHWSAVQQSWHSVQHGALTGSEATACLAFSDEAARVPAPTASTTARLTTISTLVRMIYLNGRECVEKANAVQRGRRSRP